MAAHNQIRIANIWHPVRPPLVNLIDLGRCVRSRRAELGLSQPQLAHLSGVSCQTLVGLENGTLSGVCGRDPGSFARRRVAGIVSACLAVDRRDPRRAVAVGRDAGYSGYAAINSAKVRSEGNAGKAPPR